jgi:glucuronokinase
MIIETYSYPRAALIGNPSDGYFGKTIAFVFSNYRAKVQLYQTPELEIIPEKMDVDRFANINELAAKVSFNGYYGGLRLIKAAIKVFYHHCTNHSIQLDCRNFTIRYCSDIPLRLGLAGSSAIITACFKALMTLYGVDIPKPQLANLVLSVENKELGIAAGLQDRVAQAYEIPVYMNFSREIMEKQGYGEYEPLNGHKLPNLYIAFRRNLSEGTEVLHNNLRARYNIGEKAVYDAMEEWSQLTLQFREALSLQDYSAMAALINRNFDLRRSLVPIEPGNIEMVELARSAGASAKFTGSGGAIIGTYTDDTMFASLVKKLGEKEIEVIKPAILGEGDGKMRGWEDGKMGRCEDAEMRR